MTNFHLMLNTYFYRINDERVQEELLKFNIITKNSNGEMLDSLAILKDIINLLKELQKKDEIVMVHCIVQLIVGLRCRNIFIEALLGNVWDIEQEKDLG